MADLEVLASDERSILRRGAFAQFTTVQRRVIVGWTLVALGVLALLIAWIGVSDKPMIELQMPYAVSGGLGGIVLSGAGGLLLLAEAMRFDRARLDDLESMIEQLTAEVAALREDLTPDSRPANRRATKGSR